MELGLSSPNPGCIIGDTFLIEVECFRAPGSGRTVKTLLRYFRFRAHIHMGMIVTNCFYVSANKIVLYGLAADY